MPLHPCRSLGGAGAVLGWRECQTGPKQNEIEKGKDKGKTDRAVELHPE